MADYNQNKIQNELQEEYLKNLDGLEDGQLIDGTIVAVHEGQVFIDIGYKSEGKINISQFEDPPQEGDIIKVVLISKEGRNGEVIVSKQKADERISWQIIKKAYQNNTVVEGTISKVIKGGFEISLGGGNRGFNPVSKIDLYNFDQPEKYVGMKSNFYIERLYSEQRVNIILSRRRWLEEEMNKKREDFFNTIQVDDSVKGVVKSFTAFGAFIDLGGFDGLLHINDVSWGHVSKIREYIKKGDELELKVIYLDPESKKINLSLKHFKENPWENFTELFQLHDVVKGKVTKITDFGAFVELENGIEGLVHISEFSWTKHIKHPSEILKIGDVTDVKILGFDLEVHKISLGIKQITPNPWDTILKKYPINSTVTIKIVKITNNGIFAELEEGIQAYLHPDDISWIDTKENIPELIKVGEEIEVKVLHIDTNRHNIRVGIKQLSENPWEKFQREYPTGTILTVIFQQITDSGMEVKTSENLNGLIPNRHLVEKNKKIQEEFASFNKGDEVQVSVLDANPKRHKLIFSIREVNKIIEKQEIEKYMVNESENKSAATLADIIQKDTHKLD